MKLLITMATALTLLCASLAIASSASPNPAIPKYDSVEFTKDNFVTLIGDVDNTSIDSLIVNIEKAKADSVYIYIDSPGGDVLAGVKLIEYFSTTKKNITCVAKVAISMAHQIMQACPVRLGTPHNVMMQHRMAAGVKGSVNQMQGLLTVLSNMERQLNTMSANRIGIPLEVFYAKVTQEWWTFGPESKELNIIDDIKNIRCSAELYKTETKTVVVQQGQTFNVILNGCPLVDMKEDTSVKAKK